MPHSPLLLSSLASWLLWSSIASAGPQGSAADSYSSLLDARDKLIETDRQALAGWLASPSEGVDPPSLAFIRKELAPPPGPPTHRFLPLPEIEPVRGPSQAPLSDSAKRWFALAQRALAANQLALADGFLRQAVAREPDLADARRLLGFLRQDDQWVTPHASRRLKAGQVLHPTFGWVPQDWVAKLDQGLLPSPGNSGQWIPSDQADALRQKDFSRAWKIETPHFEIRANVPLAQGIDFGRRLEAFHQLFSHLMADVIGADRSSMATLARKPTASPSLPPTPILHRVRYFATKQEYVDNLRSREGPSVELSLGLYVPKEVARGRGEQEASYFFHDPGGQIDSVDTLYHEVSHQLLFELSGPSRYERNLGHFWVFEGLGTYFETVRPQHDGTIEVGGKVGPRMAEARRRIVELDQMIPTSRLVTLGRNEYNDSEEVYLHYAQSMALVSYLMDGEGQRLRGPFLQYAADAYRGRLREAAGRSLEDRLGFSYDELDQRLKAFLTSP